MKKRVVFCLLFVCIAAIHFCRSNIFSKALIKYKFYPGISNYSKVDSWDIEEGVTVFKRMGYSTIPSLKNCVLTNTGVTRISCLVSLQELNYNDISFYKNQIIFANDDLIFKTKIITYLFKLNDKSNNDDLHELLSIYIKDESDKIKTLYNSDYEYRRDLHNLFATAANAGSAGEVIEYIERNLRVNNDNMKILSSEILWEKSSVTIFKQNNINIYDILSGTHLDNNTLLSLYEKYGNEIVSKLEYKNFLDDFDLKYKRNILIDWVKCCEHSVRK